MRFLVSVETTALSGDIIGGDQEHLEAMSSSTVNVLWGMFNLVVGYFLMLRVGRFDLRQTMQVVVRGLGVLAMALLLAHQLGKLHGGNF